MDASQQIRVDLVLRMLLTDVGPWSHTCQTQLSHQLLYLFSIEYISVGDKVLLDFTNAIKRVQGVFLIDQIQNFRLLLVWYGTPRRQIDCRAIVSGQRALLAKVRGIYTSIHPLLAFTG
jgi:hypothetical protein